MKQKLLLSFCLAFALFFQAMAQDRSITGTVTDGDSGEPIPGVSIVIKGTSTGTVTDVNGKYTIVSSQGATLVFSAVGFGEREIIVGTESSLDVKLLTSTKELGEVVVTAVGIERDKKALGYAVSTISNEQIEQKTEGDIGRLLRGKAAGVQVTQTSGLSGSGTSIIIRGYSTVNGSNQPLFVVDGVPFNSNTNTSQNFVDGQTESSRFLDLDPNNIESVNVLKGLSATVLYGDRGRNGVILITTKNGSKAATRKKNEVTVTQSVFANQIASLPDYTESYGAGFFNQAGPFFSNWGPSFSEVTSIAHPYQQYASFLPEYDGAQYDYKDYKPVENFFRTGIISNTSVNLRGSTDKANYSVSYSYYDDAGFTPGNNLVRNTLGFGGSASLTNNFTVSATFNYTNTDYQSPPVAASLGSGTTGSGGSIFGDLMYTPPSIDLNNLPFENPITGASIYYRGSNDIQNPRWTAKNARTGQVVDRFFGQANVSYQLKDWLNILYRVGLDTYTEDNEYGQNKGGVDGNILGYYTTTTRNVKIINHDWIVNFNKNLSESVGLNVIAGFNARRDILIGSGVSSTNQEVFGSLKHFNFREYTGFEFEEAENRLGVYLQAELSFKDYLFFTLASRNDWTNTLEKGNNSLFYPAASVAFDLTSAFDGLKNNDILSYLKLRLGYGSSANFPGSYNTRNTVGLTTRAFVPRGGSDPIASNAVSNRLGNPNLQPERLNEVEAGIESRFLNDRFSLELSIYNKTTTDLLLNRQLDPSTGFTDIQINAGKLRVRGLELDFNANVLKLGDFNWDISGNFVIIRSKVLELPEGNKEIAYAGFTNLGNFAIEGEPLGVIQGSVALRDENGNKVVGSNGEYLTDPDIKIIANPNRDFTTAITSTFSWKGIRFSMEWQYEQGGQYWSQTAGALVGRGVTKETDVDRRASLVLPGVNEEGQPNNVQIAATDFYFGVIGFGPDEFQVFDATTLRLNEVSLSYGLPKNLLNKTPFGSVEFTLSGYNLWYEAFNFPDAVNFDTNVLGTGVGNGQGLDFISGPSSKRFGGSVKVTF
ncbi:MAG: SusC/RagA family TonB-linked outer membrane protein [Microscillaceae bacterium]|nr:SusC/RagA family TonB-linked outer membrane protein [Microscillaceae bacterium]